MKIVVITYQNFPMKDLLLILIQRVMTYRDNLNSLYFSDFSQSELSMIKLLVLDSLSYYDVVNVCSESGNIYELLTRIKSKLLVLQSKSMGELSGDSL